MRYLICNTNTHGHVDYEKPITVHKSTDYRTTTGTNHRYIPPHPQDFDARVKFPRKTVTDPILRDEFYLSDTHRNYKVKKSVRNPMDPMPAQNFQKLNFLKSVEEKLFRNPPRPLQTPKTEFKEAYERKSVPHDPWTPGPTVPGQLCEMRAFGRDEQPPLRPDEGGSMKYLDIYLTTSRASYIPYSEQKQNGIGRKDIITFYDSSGFPIGGKGYGPKNPTIIKPLVPRRVKFDPKIAKYPVQTITPIGATTEYARSYQPQTRSDFYPYLFELGVVYKEAMLDASRWQALAPNGMYCTETCHIGTGYPVRAVVDVKTPEKVFTHNIRDYCDCINKV